MNPEPTPYDILDIPVFAYVPGIAAWLTVLALALFSFVLIYWFLKRKRRLKLEPFLTLRNELVELESSPPNTVALSRVSLMTRRLLATFVPSQCSQLAESTAAELRARAKQANSSNLRSILECLAQIDEARYSGGSGLSPETIKRLREGLIALEFELPVLQS